MNVCQQCYQRHLYEVRSGSAQAPVTPSPRSRPRSRRRRLPVARNTSPSAEEGSERSRRRRSL